MLNITRVLTGRRQPQPAEPAHDRSEGPADTPPCGPSLVILTSDAARAGGYRIHRFEDAAAAGRWIEFWYPPEHRHGIIAFWALDCPPEDEPDYELVTLIHDDADPELAYARSFDDHDGARAFLGQELAAGLDPRQVSLHWALSVTIGCTAEGEARLNPARPPERRNVPVAGPVPQPAPEVAPRPAPQRAPRLTPEDLVVRVRSVLRPARWQPRQEAFQTFGSPPNRF
jgi:hypothetical protein